MQVGVQFSGAVGAGGTGTWFTHSWPATWHVIWYCVPTSPIVDGPAQIEWKVKVDRQAASLVKYFIEVKNLTGGTVNFEARYAILNL
jgi:hypothetical protein